MYFLKKIFKDVFSELLIILLFSLALIFSWFISLGSNRGVINNSAIKTMQSQLAKEDYNYLSIDTLALKDLAREETDISRDEALDFLKDLDKVGFIFIYDELESAAGVPVYISGGTYTDYIDEFKGQEKDVKVIASSDLEPIYGPRKNIMNADLKIDLYTDKDVSAYYPSGDLNTKDDTSFIWINFKSIQALKESQLIFNPSKLLQGLIFKDFDTKALNALSAKYNKQQMTVEVNKLKEKAKFQGDSGLSFQAIVTALTTLLATITYMHYLINVVKKRYRDYLIHYFWGAKKVKAFFRIFLFIFIANLIPIIYLIDMAINFSGSIAGLALAIYVLSIILITLYLCHDFSKQTHSLVLLGGSDD